MTISVIIATRNRAPLLQQTLDVLRRQPFEAGDEVLVVDNASTDDTPRVIARAAQDFPVPLRQLHEAIPGKSAALNRAIADARGEVIALTDDDVLVADDWIATARRLFADPTMAVVGGRVDPRWEQAPPAWLRVEENGQFSTLASPLALLHYGEAQALGDRTAVGANMVIRHSVLDVLGGFATYLGRREGTLLCGEDHDLCARANAGGFRIEYRPELRVRHWVPASRLTLRYFVRWFFWSGITEVIVERTWPNAGVPSAPAVKRYLVREFVGGLTRAGLRSIRGQRSEAAVHLMESMCALGRMAQHAIDWWERTVLRGSSTSAPAAPARRPAAATSPDYLVSDSTRR